MADPVVAIEDLSKTYRAGWRTRAVLAVDRLSLSLEPGTVTALVGPNGAGKTTTIYALLGMLRPDSGSVRLFGRSASDPAARARLGYQSEIFYTYPFLSARRALRFYGRLSGMDDGKLRDEIPAILDRIGLGSAMDRKSATYSKGMVQRLGLAQALLHRPDLLILDEPTTGLDPEGRRMVAKLIRDEKERGATIFLSSHILSDVERSCDRVIMIRAGSVVHTCDLREESNVTDEWEIHVAGLTPEQKTALEAVAAVTPLENVHVVRCASAAKQEIVRTLAAWPVDIVLLRRRVESLEDLYMKHLGGSVE